MVSNPFEARGPLAEAERLAPLVRAAAEQIEADRELPRPVFEALADAGLFLQLVPRSVGGPQVDLPTYARVLETIARADASTAWALNQGTVFGTFAACLAPAVAREIWLETPRAVVANTPQPVGIATPVPGGYRVNGRMGFSTGCRHAAWFAAVCRVVADGQVRLLPNGQPESRCCLIPAAEVRIEDTWDVRGLRGTGTHHFVAEDVFVPAERSEQYWVAPPDPPAPLYRLNRPSIYAIGDASAALGVAHSAVEAFLALAQDKTPYRSTTPLREQALAQQHVGRAMGLVRSGRALLTEAVGELWAALETTGEASKDLRAGLRLATTQAIRSAVDAVDAVYDVAGATAIYRDHPIQRLFQDIHVITQHPQGRLNNYELVGRHALGVDSDWTWM